jgi:hypothetical protein
MKPHLAGAVSISPNSQYHWIVAMPKSVHITARRPTLAEMEKHFPISKARKKELQVLVEEFKAQLSRQREAPVSSTEPEKRRKRASAA